MVNCQLQQILDLLLNVLNLFCRFEACYHLTFLINQELGEVPLDVGLLFVVRVGLSQHVIKNVCNGVFHIPTCKALLFFQELEEWVGIVAINLNFLEAWEVCSEV